MSAEVNTPTVDQALQRLHLLITKAVPAALRFDKKSAEYKEGVAETIFPSDGHLQSKLVAHYDSALDFLAYYSGDEPAVKLLAHLTKEKCTPQDTNWFRGFMLLAHNQNIKEYVSLLQQSEDWLKYLKASRVNDYGNVENWYKFYAWLGRHAHESWQKFLLGRFIVYR